MKKLLAAAFFLVTSAAMPGFAADTGSIRLENAFTRSAPTGGVGGFYVTIVNTGATDRLIAVASPVAGKAELHESMAEDGIIKMRGVTSLAIPANGTVRLMPGGYHVMLFGLTQPLVEGQSIPVTLVFEKAGRLEVSASVSKAGAAGPIVHDMKPH